MYLIRIVLLLSVAAGALAAPRTGSPLSVAFDPHELRRPACFRARTLDEDSLHFYDAVCFEPHLRFVPASNVITGYVLVHVTAHDRPLNRLDFRFTPDDLPVDSVWCDGGRTASFTTAGFDSLQVFLDPPLAIGETLRVGIAYHGIPGVIDSWGGFRWAAPTSWQPRIGFSNGDGLALDPPPANYNWFPCYADPTDKVTWDAYLEAPSAFVVQSGGVLVDTVSSGDGWTTWHYRLEQPVSTYLLFVAISTYEIQVQRAAGPRIENYVYPSRAAQARVHFANVPAVLDSFAARFGPFPFPRFGYVMTRLGDMEHATCVSHYDLVVQANHTYDWLLFHELGHQWWGDWVTCGDWRDLWINEGFGTYCEALGMEALYGREAYRQYVVSNFFAQALNTSENFPIYDPQYYWGATVYEKGASVMHMLRCLLGDSAFFRALREFGQEHAYGNAVTSDWQAKLEQHYGDTLGWFFRPWVYGRRYPQYHVVVGVDSVRYLVIGQRQTTGTYFRMPIDLRLYNRRSRDSCEITLWNEAVASQQYIEELRNLPFDPDCVRVDPYDKILKRATWEYRVDTREPLAAPVHSFCIRSLSPNPFNAETVLHFELPRSSPIRLRVFNLLGREVASEPYGVFPAGHHRIRWCARDAASGVYLFRLETEHEARTAKAVLLK